MKRKFLTLIIALIFLLSQFACSDNKPKAAETIAPNYIVKDITESLGLKAVSSIKINSENQLVLYDGTDGSNRYITVDAEGKIVNEIKCDFKGSGQVFALDADDNLYILVQNAVSDPETYKITENTRQLMIYNPKGEKLKSVELGKLVMQKDENIYVQSMSIDFQGTIYLVKYNESLEVIDKDGKPLKTPISGVYGFLDVDEKGNVLTGSTGAEGVKSFIACMDSKNGKAIWKKDLDVGTYIRSLSYNKADKCIYAVTEKGVDKFDANGNLLGTVLEFMKYNLVKNGTYIYNVSVDSSGSLYFLIYEKEVVKVQKFEIGDGKAQADSAAPDQKSPAEKRVITLAAHYSDRWLESVVSAFQSEHPDIEISVKDYKAAYYGGGDTPEEANKRAEEFVKTINTELMAGKGPDIVYFGDLPYRKYIDKNMFANLSELMEKDDKFNRAELNTNILDALKYKDGLYVVPINYQFEMMLASKPILDKENIKIDDRNWTWNDLMQMAEKVTKDTNNDGVIDQYASFTLGDTGIFPYLFNSSYGKYVDIDNKKADFTGKDFIDMLNFCKAFNDKNLLYKADGWGKAMEMTARGGIAFTNASIPGYGMAKYFNETVFASDIYIFRMPSETHNVRFNLGNMLAINRNSKFLDESWELIKLLLSKESQASPELQNGFPINNEALKETAKFSVDVLKMPQAYVDAIDQVIPNVKEYLYDDGRISGIVQTEVRDFFAGSKSAEETAKIIQNKATISLNE